MSGTSTTSQTFYLGDLQQPTGFTIENSASATKFLGFVVTGVDDVDGDGIVDFLTCAPYDLAEKGACYLFYGTRSGFPDSIDLNDSNSFNATTGSIFAGLFPGHHFGYYASGVGDVNGDSRPDFAICSGAVSTNYPNCFLIFGNNARYNFNFNLTTLDGNNGVGLIGSSLERYKVAGIGNVNGGLADFALVKRSTSFRNNHAAFVLYGKQGVWPSLIDIYKLSGSDGIIIDKNITAKDSGFVEYSVAGVGDIYGDGLDSFLIGTPLLSKAYLVRGSKHYQNFANLDCLDGNNGTIFTGNPSFQTGYSVSGAGQIVKQNDHSFLIGDNFAGQVYLIHNNHNGFPANVDLRYLNGINGTIFMSTAATTRFGWSVSKAGDMNLDGRSDFVTCDIKANGNSGQCIVVFGRDQNFPAKMSLDKLGVQGVVYNGIVDPTFFSLTGYSVAALGKIDGKNNYLAFGAPQQSVQAGMVFVLHYPTPTPTPSPELVSAPTPTPSPADTTSHSTSAWEEFKYVAAIVGPIATVGTLVWRIAKCCKKHYNPENHPHIEAMRAAVHAFAVSALESLLCCKNHQNAGDIESNGAPALHDNPLFAGVKAAADVAVAASDGAAHAAGELLMSPDVLQPVAGAVVEVLPE